MGGASQDKRMSLLRNHIVNFAPNEMSDSDRHSLEVTKTNPSSCLLKRGISEATMQERFYI